MYNCGFGDCFLIFAPTRTGRDRKILIDCGSFKAQVQPIKQIVERVIEDLRDDDHTPRVDLLIVTHRHKDHISGFADPRWSEVKVGEVWMPWTESGEPEAIRLRASQTRLTLKLAEIAEAAPADSALAEVLQLNASVNDRAMETLHGGFAGGPKRRFLPEKDAKTRIVACGRCRTCLSRARAVAQPGYDLRHGPAERRKLLALLGMSTTSTRGSRRPRAVRRGLGRRSFAR
jgi:hypothetical protein